MMNIKFTNRPVNFSLITKKLSEHYLRIIIDAIDSLLGKLKILK